MLSWGTLLSRVAYADIGDVATPNLFGSGHEGIPTSDLHEDPNDPPQEHTQVQAALWLMTLRPALVDYLGWIWLQDELSGLERSL